MAGVTHDALVTASGDLNTSFDLVQTGAKGLIVAVVYVATSADDVTGVTADGIPLDRVATAADTAGEATRAYLYFLGSGIPNETLTIQVLDSVGNSKWFVAATVVTDDNADTEIVDFDALGGDAANPQVTLDSGAEEALGYVAIGSGAPATTSLADLASQTRLASIDHGANVSAASRETAEASGARALGYTASIDDVALVAALIGKAASVPGLGSPSMLLHYP